LFQAKISCDTPQNHCSICNIADLSRELIYGHRGLTQPRLRIFQNISANLGRDIEILIHATIFKCISSPGHYGAPKSGRNVSRAERQTALHASGTAARRVDRCALVFHRITYLSILRRTIGFNEVEIENAMARAYDVRGIRLINIAYVWNNHVT